MEKTIRKYWPVFLLPTFAAFVIGFIIPFAQGVYLSFCKFQTVDKATFIGFSNYVKAFQDPLFSASFWMTVRFTVVSTLLINVLALTVALLLTRKIKGTNVFRTVFFMPNLIGGIVLSYIWLMIFNSILSNFSKTIVSTQWSAFWGLIIVVCWQQIGYMMIIYIAGLQSIPEDMMEAAVIDGASKWQTLWKITIPNVMSSITICVFLTLTNSFKLFDQNLALTEGMPVAFQPDGTMVNTTEMLALNIYKTFYTSANSRGVAQAKAVLFFIMVAVLALAQLRFTRDKEVQQ